jgi:hypothetical protein
MVLLFTAVEPQLPPLCGGASCVGIACLLEIHDGSG